MTQTFNSPNHSTTNSKTDYFQENWHQRMAALVGLEDETGEIDTDMNIQDNPIHQLPLNSNQNSPEQITYKNDYPTSLAANPLVKVLFVGTATLGLVVSLGLFLSQIMGGNDRKSSVPLKQVPTNPQPEATKLTPQTQIETLKTKLALSTQAKAVKSAQMQLKSLESPPKSSPQTSPEAKSIPSAASPRVIIKQVPSPAKTVYIPRTVTVEKEKIIRVPQPVTTKPEVKTTPETSTTPEVTPSPTPNDPDKPEKKIANLPIPPTPSHPPSPTREKTFHPPHPTHPTSTRSTNQPTRSARIRQIITKHRQTVPAGSKVKAQLAIALFGESRKSRSSQTKNHNVFVVRLNQPLKTRSGRVALPQGTELLTKISNLSDTGVVELTVESAIIHQKTTSREINLPKGTMRISAEQGKPLIASQYPKRDRSIARMDAGLFILGGIGKVAQLSNRTNSEIITTSAGNIVSQNNSTTNILTGALEGGMKSIVPQITARNRQAIAKMMRNSNIWFIPAGKKLEVFLNKSLKL